MMKQLMIMTFMIFNLNIVVGGEGSSHGGPSSEILKWWDGIKDTNLYAEFAMINVGDKSILADQFCLEGDHFKTLDTICTRKTFFGKCLKEKKREIIVPRTYKTYRCAFDNSSCEQTIEVTREKPLLWTSYAIEAPRSHHEDGERIIIDEFTYQIPECSP
jgi:hypothetical protein